MSSGKRRDCCVIRVGLSLPCLGSVKKSAAYSRYALVPPKVGTVR